MDLNWFGILLVVLWVANALLSVAVIGRPRSRHSIGDALVSIIETGLLVWALVTVGTAH